MITLAIAAWAALTAAQTSPTALDTPVSLRQEYMTMDEFGKFVHDSAHVPVTVDKRISERKAAIFCENRPLSEIIARLSDTLFLDFASTSKGYVLKLKKGVEDEEKDILATQDDEARRQLEHTVSQLSGLASSTPEALAQKYKAINDSMPTLQADHSPDAQDRLTEATEESRLLQPLESNRLRWDEGYALAKAGDQAIASLEKGDTIFASTAHIRGTIPLLPQALTGTPGYSQTPSSPSDYMLMGIHFDPDTHRLSTQTRILMQNSSFGTGDLIDMATDATARQNVAERPLWKRILAWSKWNDKAVENAPLNIKADLPAADLEGCWTLADNLEWLHDRTGIPIVADSFRGFASFNTPIGAGTIKGWLDTALSYDTQSDRRMIDWLGVRMDQGWFMAKDRRYWTRFDTEIPEKYIRVLEEKSATKQPLTLDDYAWFSSRLVGRQLDEASGLVAHFPVYPLDSAELLSIWYDIGGKAHDIARKDGFPVADLSGDTLNRTYQFLVQDALFGTMDRKFIPSFLPGGPPLPADLSIFYQDTGQPGVTLLGAEGPRHIRFGVGYSYTEHPVQGAMISFGTFDGPRQTYNVILDDPHYQEVVNTKSNG